MKENVGTFYGKAETGAARVSLTLRIYVKSILVLFERFLLHPAILRLVFACLCPAFRRYAHISTTACACSAQHHNRRGRISQSVPLAFSSNPIGSSGSILLCAPM